MSDHPAVMHLQIQYREEAQRRGHAPPVRATSDLRGAESWCPLFRHAMSMTDRNNGVPCPGCAREGVVG